MKRISPFVVVLLFALLPVRAYVLQRIQSAGLGTLVPTRWNLDSFISDTGGGIPSAQNPSTLAVRYRICSDGSGSGNAPMELNAVRAAFGIWQSVPGIRVKFEELPTVAGITDVNTSDGINTIAWLAGGNTYAGGGLYLPRLATGFTGVVALDDGSIVESDIMLNKNFEWFGDWETNNYTGFFVEAIALHEIGHLLGLNHSTVGGATMFYTSTAGVNWTAGLSTDDIAAGLYLYGTPAALAQRGSVKGVVTLSGQPVLGAVLALEDTNGVVAAGGISLQDGSYEIDAVPPGSYRMRAVALDPDGTQDAHLVRGLDLDVAGTYFAAGATSFLPATNLAVTVRAGAVSVLNIQVSPGAPPFRITETRWFANPHERRLHPPIDAGGVEPMGGCVCAGVDRHQRGAFDFGCGSDRGADGSASEGASDAHARTGAGDCRDRGSVGSSDPQRAIAGFYGVCGWFF
jgi:Matrixin